MISNPESKDIKPGDTVVCVWNEGAEESLVLGEHYQVTGSKGDEIYVSLNGVKVKPSWVVNPDYSWYRERFKIVPESAFGDAVNHDAPLLKAGNKVVAVDVSENGKYRLQKGKVYVVDRDNKGSDVFLKGMDVNDVSWDRRRFKIVLNQNEPAKEEPKPKLSAVDVLKAYHKPPETKRETPKRKGLAPGLTLVDLSKRKGVSPKLHV